MPEIEWRQAARDDLRSIIEYIAQHSPAAALKMLEEIEASCQRGRKRIVQAASKERAKW